MQLRSFLLDLSGGEGIPSQVKLEQRDIARSLTKQAVGHDNLYLSKHYNRGCFKVQTSNEDTARFLRDFKLELKFRGQSFRVGLTETAPDLPKIRIRMYGTCDGEMEAVEDAFFDELLRAEGCFIDKSTMKSRFFDSTVRTGQRTAMVARGAAHLERQRQWTSPSGEVYKWRLEYDGQPHRCTRGCNEFHEDGVCPTWRAIQERRSWQGQQKCYVAGSSLVRLASDTKDVRVDCIPGAKVGHLANHLNNDAELFAKADVVVVVAGANMSYGSVEVSKPHLEYQASEMTKVLAPLVEAQKKVFVVDPVPGPIIKEPGGDHWSLIRAGMKKVARKAKAEWIPLHEVPWNAGVDLEEDQIHYSRAGTRKIFDVIQKKVEEVTGKDHFDGMAVKERPYSGMHSGHWRVGCFRCTRLHPRGQCPPLPPPEDPDVSDSSNVSGRSDTFLSAPSTDPSITSEDDGIPTHNSLGPRTQPIPSTPIIDEPLPLSIDIPAPIRIESPDSDNNWSPSPMSLVASRSASVHKRTHDSGGSGKGSADGKKAKPGSPSDKGHVPRPNANK